MKLNMIARAILFSAAAIMFGSSTAAGQSNSLPQLSDQNRPSDCQNSTLTGARFLRLIDTIIEHGDLRDIIFIERTLGTKFTMKSGLSNRNLDLRRLEYSSDEMLSELIQLNLLIDNSKGLSGYPFAMITFTGHPEIEQRKTFISDCLQLSANDFSPFFGSTPFRATPFPIVGYVPAPDGLIEVPGFTSATTDLKSPGRDGSRFQLEIGYNIKYLSVNEVVIEQSNERLK